MAEIRRVGLGAPNEAKFGFVQACRFEDEIYVAGQVGKENRTGEMLPAASFGGHVRNALHNVDESCRLVLNTGETAAVVAMAVHVPAPLSGDEVDAVRLATSNLGPAATTVVAIPALASDDYQVEISAIAYANREEDPMTVESVPYPESISRRFPGAAAVRVGGRIQAAGHVAVDPEGGLVDDDAVVQLGGALTALDRTLRLLGSSLGAITSTHVYVVSDRQLDFDALCEAHRTGVGEHRPAATLILVDSLPVPGASVMVTATAV